MTRRSSLVGPPCPASCPCRTASRETPIADLVYGMGSLRSLEEQRADERSLSAQLIAAFDAMRDFHRAEAKRRAGGEASIEGGAIRRQLPGRDADVGSTPPSSDLDSPTSPPRCIANIPTTRKRVAHQCRNRAKHGQYCALHAVGTTAPDLEQFPAALVEQPDSLPWPE